jgi:hypothetical protein
MTWQTHCTHQLRTLIDAGMPWDGFVPAGEDSDVDLEIGVTLHSLGHSDNGWDDPGDPAEFDLRITSFTLVIPLAHSFGKATSDLGPWPLTDAQHDWLMNHLNDWVQEYAADSWNFPSWED